MRDFNLSYFLDDLSFVINSMSPVEFYLLLCCLAIVFICTFMLVSLWLEKPNPLDAITDPGAFNPMREPAQELDYSTDPKLLIGPGQPETLFQKLSRLRSDDEVDAAWDRFQMSKGASKKPVLNDNNPQPRDAHGRFKKRS